MRVGEVTGILVEVCGVEEGEFAVPCGLRRLARFWGWLLDGSEGSAAEDGEFGGHVPVLSGGDIVGGLMGLGCAGAGGWRGVSSSGGEELTERLGCCCGGRAATRGALDVACKGECSPEDSQKADDRDGKQNLHTHEKDSKMLQFSAA